MLSASKLSLNLILLVDVDEQVSTHLKKNVLLLVGRHSRIWRILI